MKLDWWNIGQTCFFTVNGAMFMMVRVGEQIYLKTPEGFVPLKVNQVEQVPATPDDTGGFIIHFETEVNGQMVAGTMTCKADEAEICYDGRPSVLCSVTLASERTKAALPLLSYAA